MSPRACALDRPVALRLAEMAASLPEQARQMRAARRAGGSFIDALTALQVAKHAGDEPDRSPPPSAKWLPRRRPGAGARRASYEAGGEWSWGTGGPSLELAAVAFCRLLSGRGVEAGLLAVQVPF